MKELLRTTDPTIIAYASALLQGEGINCFPIDVHMSVLEGSVGVLPRRVMVRRQDHFRAMAILVDNDIDLGR
ncbi:MAG: putative signal transducing protein [Paracoccaceae bacterium]